MLILHLLYKDSNEKESIAVTTVWQDASHTFNRLYVEKVNDESGKGSFINLENIKCWKLSYVPNNAPKLNL